MRFAHGNGDDPLYLIGSADWMPRNLDRRVEVLVPVLHPKHQQWLDHVLAFDMADDVVRFELDAEGEWHRRGPSQFALGDGQERLYRWVADQQLRRRTASPVTG
jgi:polyphosphate kinase